MKDNKKLILHIGLHKTGSTSIQSYLFENRKKLKENGWVLFCNNPDHSINIEGNANKWVKFSGENDTFKGAINPKIFQRLKNTNGNVVISAEELSWLLDEKSIIDLSSNLKLIFDEITVVMYLRRQDSQLLSHYQQGFRFLNSTAAKFYGRYLSPYPPRIDEHYDKYLDYKKRYDHWANSFSSENIKVRIFERDRLIERDVIFDFLNICGLDFINEASPRNSNESLGKLGIVANYFSFESTSKYPYRIDMTGLDDEKFLPSRMHAVETYRRYVTSNRELFTKLGLAGFNEDKFNYPENEDEISKDDLIKVIKELNLTIEKKVSIIHKIIFISKCRLPFLFSYYAYLKAIIKSKMK